MVSLARTDHLIEHYLNCITPGDSRELAKAIPDESIDLIFTDPPYAKEFLSLYEWLAEEAARVLKPGGFLLTYCGHAYLKEIMDILGDHLSYYWQFIAPNSGMFASMWPKKIFCAYKPILAFVKGQPDRNTWVFDMVKSIRDKRFHSWGQSEMLARYYVECFTQPGNVVWEPFTGGGTVPYVCKQLGRNFIAFELDPDSVHTARNRLKVVQCLLLPEQSSNLPLWEDRR
jgi:tRNA G10  N-methylase Trm11